MTSIGQPSLVLPPSRLGALDGLRGLAAAVVLLHHTLLLTPGISAVYLGGTLPGRDSLLWWLSYSPLKLVSAGGEAVVVFFVLSGLVLTLPVLRAGTFNWMSYYPRRVVRLFIPVVASVLLAALLISLVPQNAFQSGATWLNTYSIPALTWDRVVRGVDLLGGDFLINNPLWSLQWELLFSLALPMFIVVAVWARNWWPAVVGLCCIVMWLGTQAGSGGLTYLPVFLVGAVIATNLSRIESLARRVNRTRLRNLTWTAILAISALLLVGAWLTGPLSPEFAYVTGALHALTPLAAGGLVVSALGWPALGRLLRGRPLKYLGSISFSLYLIHVPVLIFTSHLLRGMPQAVAMVIGLVLAVIVAICFYWLVESRSHGWSRDIGGWVTRVMHKSSASDSEKTASIV
ncbi:acyltransferase family protein [Glaciibacter sp. 2TAF33]|uniref:acyltransferase family protein n=1 Tax=Glaciibacter sp. 2TAF33 TaxID=3233015 RepID=UPI003F92C0FA